MSLYYVCRPAAVAGEQTDDNQQQNLADMLLELQCPSAPDTPPSDLAHAVALSYLESFIQQLEQWLSLKLDMAPAASNDGAMANGSTRNSYLPCLDLQAPDGVSARLKLNTANLHLYPALESLQNLTHTLPGWSASIATLQLDLILCSTSLSYNDTMALEEGSVVAMPESSGETWLTNLVYGSYSLPCRLDAANSILTPLSEWQLATGTKHNHDTGQTEADAASISDTGTGSSTGQVMSSANEDVDADSTHVNGNQQNLATIQTTVKVQSSDCVGAFRPIPLSLNQARQSGEIGGFHPEARLQLDNGINGKGTVNRFLQGHALYVDQIEIVVK